jgi:nicotinate-nucleotide adenylyltransferase
MVRLATADDDRFEVSDIELRRIGSSYTIDTIREIQRDGSFGKLFLVIGGDSLRSFHAWRDPDRILESVRLIVYDRDDHLYEEVDHRILEEALIIPETRLLDISGSEIRQRIAKGLSVRGLVPEQVAEYIRSHKLYQ